jgi:dipeptidyl aminopeptidase/acylaminoacyl peptidase
VDGQRLIIRGGSAGGYTTLCAVVFHSEFSAAASYYGVADIEMLARDTHKFESRYLDGLIGPSQAEAFVTALRAKGLPHAYLTFEGEAHGFRDARNIRRSLEAELYFYSRIFGFELAESIEPVEISGL